MPCIMPAPAIATVTIESQKVREKPKPTSPSPKTAAAMGIMRMSPRTLLRAASDSAETSAPTPIAPIKKSERMRARRAAHWPRTPA